MLEALLDFWKRLTLFTTKLLQCVDVSKFPWEEVKAGWYSSDSTCRISSVKKSNAWKMGWIHVIWSPNQLVWWQDLGETSSQYGARTIFCKLSGYELQGNKGFHPTFPGGVYVSCWGNGSRNGCKKRMTKMSQSSFGVSESPIFCIHFVEATTSLTSRCHYYPMESFEFLRLDPISWKPGWLRSTFHMDYHNPYLFSYRLRCSSPSYVNESRNNHGPFVSLEPLDTMSGSPTHFVFSVFPLQLFSRPTNLSSFWICDINLQKWVSPKKHTHA